MKTTKPGWRVSISPPRKKDQSCRVRVRLDRLDDGKEKSFVEIEGRSKKPERAALSIKRQLLMHLEVTDREGVYTEWIAEQRSEIQAEIDGLEQETT